MKSIRLSLIVYFLALIALALGGVSALVYQTVSTTLEEKQITETKLARARYQSQCQDAKAALDESILRKAVALASRAKTVPVPHDLAAFLMRAGAYAMPANRLVTAMAERGSLMVRFEARLNYATEVHIPGAEDFLEIQPDQAAEYFQTNHKRGRPIQRSASLRDRTLPLRDDIFANAEFMRGEFDDTEHDGVNLRRVTLRAHVASRTVFGPWGRGPFGPFPQNQTKTKGGGKQTSPPPPAIKPFEQTMPVFFIQYASDTAALDEQIGRFEDERDDHLAQLHENTRLALAQVRQRMFWIGLFTFAGIVMGGYVLVRLGLAPLARLSDAVSKVSERNFELQVNTDSMPSELRPIAERLRHSLEQLRRAFDREKHAAADISHELRTPLAALMTTLDVALRKQRSPEEYREILDECRVSGRHMTQLVERLLALARLDAGVDRPHIEPVDVAELAQQCTDMVRSLADESNLTLRTHLPDSAETLTDAGKLREIVLNLLHNAIAYNRPEGSIDVTVAVEDKMVRIDVADAGIGIAPAAQAHLFERFYRADPSRHSDSSHCGLGLAIVKSYVDLLGGEIEVQSSPAGSVFRVRLPLRAVAAAELERNEELQAVMQ